MNLRNAFLDALVENEDDTTTRLVFADWLDDNGEHEEADRQRKWPAAKEWLVQFCREHNPPPDDEDAYEYVVSYEELMEFARNAVKEGDEREFWFSCGNNMTMCDALQNNCGEFWEAWSVVTGIPLPPDAIGKSRFRCAC